MALYVCYVYCLTGFPQVTSLSDFPKLDVISLIGLFQPLIVFWGKVGEIINFEELA
jgi:hypothetical protein